MFIVSHDVTISIRNLKGLGKMVDEIIREGEGLITLTNFAWKADDVSSVACRNSTQNEKP